MAYAIPASLKTAAGEAIDRLKIFRGGPDYTPPRLLAEKLKVVKLYKTFLTDQKVDLCFELDGTGERIVHFKLDKANVVYYCPSSTVGPFEIHFYKGAMVTMAKNVTTQSEAAKDITRFEIITLPIEQINDPSLISPTYSPRHPKDSFSY